MPRSAFLRAIFLSGGTVQNEALKNLIPYDEKVDTYQLGNIIFTNSCPNEIKKDILYAISPSANCSISKKADFAIIDQKDSGTLIYIYGSSICKGISVNQWRRFNFLSDYSFKNMGYDKFCSTWISASP